MTEIYLHIVARMADYMDTHPYPGGVDVRIEHGRLTLGERCYLVILELVQRQLDAAVSAQFANHA